MDKQELLSNIFKVLADAESENYLKCDSREYLLDMIEELKEELYKFDTLKKELHILCEKLVLDIEENKGSN